ncbi:MAG TPA: disulfide bond formation protein B [Bacilli bacterium]|nr:disulfide bond formation protein B [Bacilli bacterium]
MDKFSERLLFLSWTASVIATAGSLFFSEVMNFIPCELCWMQRIFMYPLVIILGVAVFKKDATASINSAILSGIGGLIALYHYLLEKVPAMESLDNCGIIPCTFPYINWLGFITIPFLALFAFIIIFTCSVMIYKRNKN